MLGLRKALKKWRFRMEMAHKLADLHRKWSSSGASKSGTSFESFVHGAP